MKSLALSKILSKVNPVHWTRKILLTLLTSVALWVIGISISAIPNWEPTRFAIDSNSNVFRSPEFSVDLNDLYKIGIEFNLSNGDKVDCFLEDGIESENCHLNHHLNAEWILYSDGYEINHGFSRDKVKLGGNTMGQGGWSGRNLEFRNIGEFRGARNNKYILEVRFLDNIAEIMPTKPKVVVAMNYWSRIGYMDLAGIFELLSFIMFAVTIFLIINRVWHNRGELKKVDSIAGKQAH
ncbi:hypothetical protein [Solimicrobium silvestre]|uniref:Uncharacterized protein n=1 Tax=Solimicrobium silvestre TaxID=2099400 RepID=A0A2S9GYF6_9BURK|nr:hypothetical protein [Solimicrobium silvestre]PRC92730.1 hypothetical protein S2091_2460 [Solimicrobium silvestre]